MIALSLAAIRWLMISPLAVATVPVIAVIKWQNRKTKLYKAPIDKIVARTEARWASYQA